MARPYLDYAAYFPSQGGDPDADARAWRSSWAAATRRVRVNCVLPGPVMLPPDLPEAERQQAIDATLVKREGSPENVAQAVLSFLDNDFVTGVCLPVDGGRTVYAGGRRDGLAVSLVYVYAACAGEKGRPVDSGQQPARPHGLQCMEISGAAVPPMPTSPPPGWTSGFHPPPRTGRRGRRRPLRLAVRRRR